MDATGFLDEAGVEYEVLDHAHTERAADEAKALGIAADEVAKTLVVATPEGNVRAVLPASERIDLRKLGELVGAGAKQVRLATEDELERDYPDVELGAVPPFGGPSDRVIVDGRLARRDSVVLEAASHDRSLRIKSADLVRLTDARVGDISREES